jgi:deoxyribodipyrimidine photo-lyase
MQAPRRGAPDRDLPSRDVPSRDVPGRLTANEPRSPIEGAGMTEPLLWSRPPADLRVITPTAADTERLRGRPVWLVHPWALRPPPADLPEGTQVLGIYSKEHHERWPWPEARWRWVDAAMAALTTERWFVDGTELAALLNGAAHVLSVDDPHITPWLQQVAQLDTAPTLFPAVERRCTSFSQWWSRATRGLKYAEELL